MRDVPTQRQLAEDRILKFKVNKLKNPGTTAAQQDDDALAFALPHPPHPDVPAHLAAAAQAGQVSSERADEEMKRVQ